MLEVWTPWARLAGALGPKAGVHVGVGARKVGSELFPIRLCRAGPWACLKEGAGNPM